MAGIFPASGVPATEATNSLPAAQVVSGCDRLWYSTARCTPRFDPAAANAMMSEVLNLVNCAGDKYDCNRLDNMCTAVKSIVHDQINGCLDDLPVADGCKINYVVLSTDSNGCSKFATYSEVSSSLGSANSCTVWPVGSRTLPSDPEDPTSFYDTAALSLDVQAGTINEAKLSPNIVAALTVDVPCPGMQIELEVTGNAIFEPQASDAEGRLSSIVVRVDGVFPLSVNNVVIRPARWTNFESLFNFTSLLSLSQGVHNLQFYVCATVPDYPPARLSVTCNANGTSQFSVQARIPAG